MVARKPIEGVSTTEDFSRFFSLIPDLHKQEKIAVAVSGGPDSMALAYLMSRFVQEYKGSELHFLTVDHGLRAEAAQEAKHVAEWAKELPYVTHRILKWEGKKPETGLMETARQARYDLMATYCAQENIPYLFLAHHQDDQAETFLIRLSKGSGLDGLAAMKPLQPLNENLTLVRPLLGLPKEDLIALCKQAHLPYVKDPSNEKAEFLRPRLREAREVLEKEGLSSKRLAVTAARLGRAREALDEMADILFQKTLKEEKADFLAFDLEEIRRWPEEIGLRVVLKAMDCLREDAEYRARMEKVEDLFLQIRKGDNFKRTSLGKCLFAVDEKEQALLIEKENKSS